MALQRFHQRFIKRSFDICFSLVVLLTIFPVVWLIVAVFVKATTRGPVIQRESARLSRHKIALAPYNPSQLAKHNLRQFPLLRFNIPVNGFVRVTHIDRLPRVFNILLGHTSLIEPSRLPGDLHAYSSSWTPLTDFMVCFR